MAAARPLLFGLASAARSGWLSAPLRSPPRRPIYLSASRAAPTLASSTPSSNHPGISQSPTSAIAPDQSEQEADSRKAAFLGEADSNDGHEVFQQAYGAPAPALDAKNSAFLGEADSDDGFEALKAEEGDRQAPMDASRAAFLGEADSNDAFEAQKAEEGDRHEPMDATNAAFLGEADSDDGFEADIELYPEKHRHKIGDMADSGFHGERGEMDSNERVA